MPSRPETITLKFSDSVSNVINIFRAENINASVIILFPALGVKANYYRHYATALAKENIHAVTVDHRGHGNSSVRPSRATNFGYREQIETEYVAILQKVKEIFPQSKTIIMGHSLGGQMGSMFVSRYNDLADGIILNASCSVYYKGWGGFKGIGVLLFAKFSKWIAHLLGYYPGNKIGFGHIEARGIIDDWHYTAETGNFSAHGSEYNYDKAMHEMTIPVLALSYEGDASAPPLALKYLTDTFQSAKVSVHHVAHPHGKKYNHYSWIKEPQASFKLVVDWINKM
jgi:predicted alpha/beta hydrolase